MIEQNCLWGDDTSFHVPMTETIHFFGDDCELGHYHVGRCWYQQPESDSRYGKLYPL